MSQIDAGVVSDRWLRVLTVAGDAGSFTAAAERLGIGQPAVSHAIKQLESAVGVRLFDRTSAGIALTSAGQELCLKVGAGFDVVDGAVREFQSLVRADRIVSLSVSTALATYWLMPRLAAFKDAHPDSELRVITQDTDAGVGRDEADLWIPLGAGPWPSLRSWEFAHERLVAVASPEYLDRVAVPSLDKADLLHTEERYDARFDWTRWFKHHGLDHSRAIGGQRSNDYSIVVHAALQGQGVALGWWHIVAPLVADGRLVRVGTDQLGTDQSFCVVARPSALDRPGVDALRLWLLSEAAEFR